MQQVKCLVAAWEDRAKAVEFHDYMISEKTYKLWTFVEDLDQTLDGRRVGVTELLKSELIRLRSGITWAWSENEC